LVFVAVALSAAGSARAQAPSAPIGRISGSVVRGGDVPVPDTELRLVALGRVARADAGARFVFERVPAGEHLLEASHPRWGRAIERVTVTAGGTAEVTVTLLPEVHLDDIVVSAGVEAQQRSVLYQATDVVAGERLHENAQATLGETLADRPGVSSTYFGPGASRPVIRGLGSDRVRVLEGGVGSGDASTTSPDHAASVEPVSAERIEIIRGPATLLYGSGATGGIVNVLDRRIPRELPTRAIGGTIEALAGTVADEFAASATLEGAAGPLAWQASGLYRNTNDYRIPGFAALTSPPSAAPEEVLANSAVKTTRGAGGLSYVGQNAYAGVSGLLYNSTYGIPGEADEVVTIDLRQRRLDFDGTWRPRGLVRTAKLRAGYADYEHVELESGVEGTRFLNTGWEARAEAQHRPLGPVTGALGAQYSRREFSAFGEEAFVPPTTTDRLAGFLFEEIVAGAVRLQGGGRYEWQDARDEAGNVALTSSGVSLSGGVNWTAMSGLRLAVSVSRSTRLPTPEELFSDGPHLATGAFERGDTALAAETAVGLDVGLHGDRGPLHGAVTGFVTDFDGYIYEWATGTEVDGLPEFAFVQDDARFLGVEAEVDVELVHVPDGHVALELMGDYVRAELTGSGEPLPRIPPLRLAGGLRYEGSTWSAHVTVRRVMWQERVAPIETETPGYTTVDASLGYRLLTGPVVHELLVRGTNLTDADARNHVSFLKDVVPLPGRDLSALYRVYF
jgi:iron complex outermembrane receptor protein